MRDRPRRVCVYCGSNPGARASYRAAAGELGASLARRGIGLVYGGGATGLMGVAANAALAAGGEVIGVIPHHLATEEVAHRGLTELHRVETMHERKAKMIALADAFVALPGGYGTAEELFEAITWSQLGLHARPVALLNVDGFFDHLLNYLDHATAEGFLHPEYRGRLIRAESTGALLASLGCA